MISKPIKLLMFYEVRFVLNRLAHKSWNYKGDWIEWVYNADFKLEAVDIEFLKASYNSGSF